MKSLSQNQLPQKHGLHITDEDDNVDLILNSNQLCQKTPFFSKSNQRIETDQSQEEVAALQITFNQD